MTFERPPHRSRSCTERLRTSSYSRPFEGWTLPYCHCFLRQLRHLLVRRVVPSARNDRRKRDGLAASRRASECDNGLMLPPPPLPYDNLSSSCLPSLHQTQCLPISSCFSHFYRSSGPTPFKPKSRLPCAPMSINGRVVYPSSGVNPGLLTQFCTTIGIQF